MELLLALILLPWDSVFAIYAILFAVLILSGIGLPVPEEVTLFVGGYLSYLELISFWPTVYILTAGIITADIVGYSLGRFAGDWVSERIARDRRISRFLKKAEEYFQKHGEKVVLFSRPLIGIRMAVPILAGHFKMRFLKFLLFDTAAAIPWTFFLISLSHYLGSGLDFITEVREIKHAILFILGLGIVIYAAIKINVGKIKIGVAEK